MIRSTLHTILALTVVFGSQSALARRPRPAPTPTPTPAPTASPTPTPTPAPVPTAQVTVNQSNPTAVSVTAGASFQLTYNFSGGPTSSSETVFVHFVDTNDQIVLQDDHVPPTSTTTWSGAISYTRTIYVPTTIPSGTYKILVGLYDSTGRLPLLMGSGVMDAGSYRYQVGTTTVGSVAPSPTPTPAPQVTAIPAGWAVLDARNYGVKCDGITDDTVALQNGIHALQGNQALVLPSGTCVTSNYMITWPGKTNIGVFGAGMDSTIIKALNPDASALMATQANGLILSGFQIWSPNSTYRTSSGNLANGIYVEKSSYVTVDHVKVVNPSGAGFLFFVVTDSSITNSVDQNSWADAFHITGGSKRVTVQYNTATHPGDDCFPSIGYSGARNEDISFFDNTCTDGWWGGGVAFDGTLRGKAYRNKIYRSGISCFRSASWHSYPTEPNDQIDFQDNYGENCVTRTDTGHGAIMLFTDLNNITNVTMTRTTIVNPMSGIGVRAFGLNGATVQATLTNTTVTGASNCYSIEAGATVVQVGNTCN